jgi:1,2-diacylglycerol 3-beta-galactosyltransferase
MGLQEEGNIPYVIDNHVGAFETNPARIGALISEWFGPQRQQLADMARRSKALGRPQAVYQIAGDLCKILDERLEQTRLQVQPLQQQQQPKLRLAAAA